MAKVEVHNERPTYTLHLNENEFWALLVAFGGSSALDREDALRYTSVYRTVPESVDVGFNGVGLLHQALLDAAVTA